MANMFKSLSLLLTLFCSVPLHGEVNSMCLETTNGVKHIFILEEKPVSWYENKNFCTSVDGNKVSVLASEVKCITFYEDQSLSNVSVPIAGEHKFSIDDRILIMPAYNGKIMVYDVQGRSMNVEIVESADGIQVDLSLLHSGIYVIETECYVFKLYLR
ncbi:MAG: hypothetical protein NC421_02000 [Lachnospiraceae bacterium]|nr:hypothetical protein [Lachnospiraceae bacterium]